jgi:hypothetical protein
MSLDCPETLAILGTQDIGQINVRENPRGNQEKDNPDLEFSSLTIVVNSEHFITSKHGGRGFLAV